MCDERECVVCYYESETCAQPCGHRLCASCAQEWSDRNVRLPQCPVCRQPLSGLWRDSPPPCTKECVNDDGARVFCVEWSFEDGGHAGVAIGRRGCMGRLVITRLAARDLAAKSGLREGDELVNINGLRLSVAATAIALIEHRRTCRGNVVLTVRRTKRNAWWKALWKKVTHRAQPPVTWYAGR